MPLTWSISMLDQRILISLGAVASCHTLFVFVEEHRTLFTTCSLTSFSLRKINCICLEYLFLSLESCNRDEDFINRKSLSCRFLHQIRSMLLWFTGQFSGHNSNSHSNEYMCNSDKFGYYLWWLFRILRTFRLFELKTLFKMPRRHWILGHVLQ